MRPADISVVIPAYNAGRFVGEAIESVLTQSLPPDEIIVVDDGSEDETAVVVRKMPSVTYHYQANAGQAAARNAGLALAKCDLVAFLDADDLMKPSRLKAQFDYLTAHPDVDMVCGRQEIEILDGTVRPAWLDLVDPVFGDPGGVVVEPSLMARAESLKRLGGFDETLVYSVQVGLLARIREENVPFVVMDRVVITRRIHEENMSNDLSLLGPEAARALHDHLKRTRGVDKR